MVLESGPGTPPPSATNSDASHSIFNKVLQNPEVVNSPWFQKAYQSAVEFYEKDKDLNPKDRLELSRIYLSIARAQLWGGWGGFAIVFGAPFAHRLYTTGAIKGTKVPQGFLFGIVTMFFSSHIIGGYAYRKKLQSLAPTATLDVDSTVEKDGKQKQYEMMKLLDSGMPTRWSNYFYMTYKNPERRIPDPAKKMAEVQNGVSPLRKSSPIFDNRDPLGLYTGPQFDKKEGVPKLDRKDDDLDPFEDSPSAPEELSSWDKIREENKASNAMQGSSWEEIRKNNSNT